jgi:HEAT repeat protein
VVALLTLAGSLVLPLFFAAHTPGQPGAEAAARGKAEAGKDEPPGRGKLVVKRLQKLDEEELRKQLLLAPEVSLDALPGSGAALAQVAARMQAVGLVYPGPVVVTRGRPDLLGLPLRMGFDCHLGKEPAENLQALSRKLRAHLEASLPPGGADPRPDPDTLERRLLAHSREWLTPDAIPALLQLLQGENKPVRLVLIGLLARIDGPRATQALAMRSLVDLSPEVRESALRALRDRAREDYRDLLVAGLRYPWALVREHAAEALVALGHKEAVPQLVELLDLPDPESPFPVTRGKRKAVLKRELVRVNHLANCVLCHAPSFARADLVRGAVPAPGRPLPAPATTPAYYEHGERFVRADVTYLRQDFSVIQPVLKADRWPNHQRFDYLVRTRPLTGREVRLHEKEKDAPATGRGREPALFALRELTGKDYGDRPARWRKLAALAAKPDPGAKTPRDLVTARGAARDWAQFLALREGPVKEPAKEPDPKELGEALIKAPPEAQDRILAQLRDGVGVAFTDALARALPELEGEAVKRARTVLAERLARMTPATLKDKLREEDSEVRRGAAVACAMRDLKEMVPDIIALLKEDSDVVRPAARAALKALSGQDFGPRPGATAKERAEAVRRWESWWKEQGKR